MSFDFTPQFTHGDIFPNQSNVSNQDFVDALNYEYNNNSAEWEEELPTNFKPSKDPTGYWTAAQTLASWYWQQLPGCNGPGCSAGNPYAVPFTGPQKQDFLAGLGSKCDTSSIFKSYENNSRWTPAVSNTYFNLGRGEKSFEWNNGSLCISDIYNFEGIRDFGVGASTIDDPSSVGGWLNWLSKAIVIQGVVGIATATPIAMVRGLLNGLKNDPGPEDTWDPFTNGMRGDNVIGNVARLYLKNCFSSEEICQSNNELYKCALGTGKIPYDPGSACLNGDSCIEVGQAQPSPILGFPSYAPTVMEISPDSGSLSFGGSSGYPAPFTSFSQQIVNANNILGPYAMFGGMSGRLVVIVSGNYSGELGFICQNWYNFNDGSYARDSNGDLYPSKQEWWGTCLKSKMTARFLPLQSRPQVEVMVATKSFSDNNSPEVFSADYPIVAAPIASIALTSVLAALPSAALVLI